MYVKRIRFENIKGFQELDFNLERPDGRYAGWTVFVGGNSSGKSTLLKATALALMGPDAGRSLMGTTKGWIFKRETKASAVLSLTWDEAHDGFKRGGARPGMAFDAGVRWFFEKKGDDVPQFRSVEKRNAKGGRVLTPERGPWDPNAAGWFSAGYGPMRRLSGSSPDATRYAVSKEVYSRFVTLFREDAALSESEEWLRREHARQLEASERVRAALLEGVKLLLGDGLLPHGMKVSSLTVDHVYLKDRRGVDLPMRDISDGCRSIYATVLDLVHSLFDVYGGEELFATDENGRPIVTRPGVVIIDEIEAHLHPAWQRDIPYWLKEHFPNIQFLVSTHSPLVAQAADENGLFILPLQDDLNQRPRAASQAEYTRVRWGTAHKTVLGVAFGLSTTRTRWAQEQIGRWQQLSAKQEAGVALTAREKRDFGYLRKQLELALDGAPSIDAI